MRQKATTLTIERIFNDYQNKTLIINKDYQRDYVWKDGKVKSELIHSLINVYPTGTLIFWEKEDESKVYNISEIIDGQQRLITIFEFILGKFTISKDVTRKIVKENATKLSIGESKGDLKSINLLSGKIERISFNNIPDFLKRNILIYSMSIVTITDTNIDEIKQYFSAVQNQEKLKAGELIHSLPNNSIREYFSNSSLSNMADALHFNNERKDILKQLNMITALNLGMIRMGTPDKDIVKAAEKLNNITIDEETSNILKQILKDFSNIYEYKKEEFKDYFRVFGLKLLFISYLFPNESFLKKDIFTKRKIIKEITNLSGKFNSSDLDKKKEIPEEIFKNMENIWKLSKTTHSKSDVQIVFENHFYNVVNYIETHEKF